MAIKKGRLKFYIFLIIFLCGILFLIFNDYGLIKYLRLEKEVNTLSLKIDSLETENKNLEAELDSLQKKIPAKIEKTAREKYNMIREGEKVIKVNPPKD